MLIEEEEEIAINTFNINIYKNDLKYGSGILGVLGWSMIYYLLQHSQHFHNYFQMYGSHSGLI